MRAISLVNKIELEIGGSVMRDALAFGDVDNDNGNELAAGTVQGDLFVFKGMHGRPWRSGSELGMINTVIIGDILNEGKNYLVSISGEGWCHIFDVNRDGMIQEDGSCPAQDEKKLLPCHTQRLPANTKMAILADLDNDGNLELVIALTDRVVRSYRWTKLPGNGSDKGGKLLALNKWEFASQIGSVTLHSNRDRTSCLLVSQPGGTYVRLDRVNDESDTAADDAAKGDEETTLDYHPLTSTKMRNPFVTTEIIGNVKQDDGKPPLFAVATLDGTLMLVGEEGILWSLQVDHQLFCLTKLDVTGDGRDEVIACSWDGQTYIVNHEHQSIRFQFEESVSTFTAGLYSLDPGTNTPCLTYATFNNKLCVFYDVHVDQAVTSSLIERMNGRQRTAQLLQCARVEPENTRQLQQLYAWCLYGFPSENEGTIT